MMIIAATWILTGTVLAIIASRSNAEVSNDHQLALYVLIVVLAPMILWLACETKLRGEAYAYRHPR